MKIKSTLSSHRSWIAIAVTGWALSLALVSFVVEQDHQAHWGIEILLMGAFGFVVGQFAWFANILFFLALITIKKGGEGNVSLAMFAALISLHSLFFQTVPTDEGGGSTDIYGYGIGMFVWICSMFAILIAASLRAREIELAAHDEESRNPSSFFLCFGILGFSATIVVPLCLGLSDRFTAVGAERSRINSVVYKRGPVCGVNRISPVKKLTLTGPLEMELSGVARNPTVLLKFGIPAVRYKGFDYRTNAVTGEPVAVPADLNEDASAVYSLENRKGAETQSPVNPDWFGPIRARLYSRKDGTNYFSYSWEMMGQRRCPEQDESEILLSALNVTQPEAIPSNPRYRSTHEIRIEAGTVTSTSRATKPKGDEIDIEYTFTANCPKDTGWKIGRDDLPFLRYFQVGRKFYHLGDGGGAYCDGESVFFHRSEKQDYTESSTGRRVVYLSLYLQERSLVDLRELWEGTVKVELEPGPDYRFFRVIDIKRELGKILVHLEDDKENVMTVSTSGH